MNDVHEPYGAADARADAARLRKAKGDTTDLLQKIRDRLAATEGARRPDLDPDYPDMSEALRYLDQAIGANDMSLLKQVAQEMVAAADALDAQRSNTAPKTKTTDTQIRKSSRPARDADQIWIHDGKPKTAEDEGPTP